MSTATELVVKTGSVDATQCFGRRLGELLPASSLVLLSGDLGSGKTALTHGIARGLGVADNIPITSPTYTLMNSYCGRVPLYHFDLYRLSEEDELIDLGFDDYFHGEGVAVVEWSERCPSLRSHALSIDLSYLGESARQLIISCPPDSAYAALLPALDFV